MPALIIAYFVCLVAAVAGYVMNIIDIVNASLIDPLFILRCFGIVVAPLGAVLGWF